MKKRILIILTASLLALSACGEKPTLNMQTGQTEASTQKQDKKSDDKEQKASCDKYVLKEVDSDGKETGNKIEFKKTIFTDQLEEDIVEDIDTCAEAAVLRAMDSADFSYKEKEITVNVEGFEFNFPCTLSEVFGAKFEQHVANSNYLEMGPYDLRQLRYDYQIAVLTDEDIEFPDNEILFRNMKPENNPENSKAHADALMVGTDIKVLTPDCDPVRFEAFGINQDSTKDEVIEKLGQPSRECYLVNSSYDGFEWKIKDSGAIVQIAFNDNNNIQQIYIGNGKLSIDYDLLKTKNANEAVFQYYNCFFGYNSTDELEQLVKKKYPRFFE